MMKIIAKSNQGFSLFEVLIALFILSVGLIGLANLQGQSMVSSYNALLRTQAISMAQEIVDRMRANRAHALLSTSNYITDFTESPPTTSVDCSSNFCSEAQMALLDLREWKCKLGKYAQSPVCNGVVSRATLPNGEGSVTAPDATTGQSTVTISWTNTNGETDSIIIRTSL